MTLSPQDIRRWSERGDPIQAWYSYEMVRESLTPARLGDLSLAVYPQGSYANKTNIVADSDVDIVVSLRSAFYPDKSDLLDAELAEYTKYYERADRTWHDFREEVCTVLRNDFSIVQEGSKAIMVNSGLIRLPADVLVALDHRCYRSFPSFEKQSFIDGVQFYASGTRKIVNYPRRHMKACSDKDFWTSGKYRNVVRIAKNARNALIADRDSPVEAGTAPSYFLESLLWNVPEDRFNGRVEDAYGHVISWLAEHPARLGDMTFPNRMGGLFDRTADTSWSQPAATKIIGELHRQVSAP
jgi:predicted nucleotidyltransferase